MAVASTVTLENGPVIAPASQNETGAVTEIAGVTGSTTADQATGTINFTDSILTDVNTASASLVSAVSSGNAIPAATSTALGTALAKYPTPEREQRLGDGELEFLAGRQQS